MNEYNKHNKRLDSEIKLIQKEIEFRKIKDEFLVSTMDISIHESTENIIYPSKNEAELTQYIKLLKLRNEARLLEKDLPEKKECTSISFYTLAVHLLAIVGIVSFFK